AAFATRHRLFLGGTVALPYGIRLNPFMVASSGVPFDITTGHDLNGDSIFNDRPSFATDLSRPSVVVTHLGTFDTLPLPGQPLVPINYGTSDPRLTINLPLSKSFALYNPKSHHPCRSHAAPGVQGGPGGGRG